jgi:hypothetical protein
MTAFGASHPLPCVPAKVSCLITQRTFSLGGGNYSSCPICDVHGPNTLRSVGFGRRALWIASLKDYLASENPGIDIGGAIAAPLGRSLGSYQRRPEHQRGADAQGVPIGADAA